MDRRLETLEPAAVGVRFQFHATPEELVDLARSWRDAHDLHLAGEQFFPDWHVFALEGDELLERLDAIDRLALRRNKFDLMATTANAFTEGNPGSFYIHVQKVTGNELGEAAIGGYTSDPAEADLWRRLIRKVRAACHKGASVKNWAAGAKVPSHRHTTGAHRLAERGMRMVAFPGGGTEYTFDDLPAISRPTTE
jgi:hypothetical protein